MGSFLDLNCFSPYKDKMCVFSYCSKTNCDCVSRQLLNTLSMTKSTTIIKDIFQSLDSNMDIIIESSDVIQYSTLEKCTIPLIEHLEYSKNKGFSFKEVGSFLQGKIPKKTALIKYGENHSKLAEKLGLVEVNRSKRPFRVFVSKLGSELLNINDGRTDQIIANLALKVKIIQFILYKSSKGKVIIEDELSFLEKSTFSRRISSIKGLLDFIYNNSEINLDYLYKDIYLKNEPKGY